MWVIDLFKHYRFQKLEDKLNDTRYYLNEWGFARTPSEIRKIQAKIARLEEKIKNFDRN